MYNMKKKKKKNNGNLALKWLTQLNRTLESDSQTVL